eukprot:1136525-Pyramimonas_sp.AAC.3
MYDAKNVRLTMSIRGMALAGADVAQVRRGAPQVSGRGAGRGSHRRELRDGAPEVAPRGPAHRERGQASRAPARPLRSPQMLERLDEGRARLEGPHGEAAVGQE